ncbi:hypothetical protein SEA_INTOLERANT_77 [Streptomyces phage Intolerant]|nr:hypothetical protein SEA_INTOLERANT_77 [Streptomyces phage Intolerant]
MNQQIKFWTMMTAMGGAGVALIATGVGYYGGFLLGTAIARMLYAAWCLLTWD